MNNVVIIQSYNNEMSIKSVIEDYKQYFNDIYVYDIGSTDNTKQIVIDSGIKLLTGTTISKIFNELDADYIVLTNGNYMYDAYDSFMMLQYCMSHDYDMIIGNRKNINSKSYNFQEKALNNKAEKLFRKYISDILSESRVISKNFYKNIELKTSYINVELTKLCINFAFMDISYHEKSEYSKPTKYSINDYIKINKLL